jgi:hypothetical protein
VRRLFAAVGLAAAFVAGCSEEGGGDLVWVKGPAVYRQETLPRDRVLVGTIRNDSLRRITIAAKDVYAVDADGNELRGNATFIRGYIHPLYPPERPPEGGLPEAELERLGRQVRLEPGTTAPLSVAWRVPPGERTAARIEYGSGSLPAR